MIVEMREANGLFRECRDAVQIDLGVGESCKRSCRVDGVPRYSARASVVTPHCLPDVERKGLNRDKAKRHDHELRAT